MSRPVSDRVSNVRLLLEQRLRNGLHRPGDRFLSNRAVATQYGVSYQTAQRVMTGLVNAGLLVRHRGAGSYLPGREDRLRGVELLFHIRAKRSGSFGAKLRALLVSRLARLGIEATARFIDSDQPRQLRIAEEWLPVIWDLPAVVDLCGAARRNALVLNDRPASGFAATYIDSVSIDDFSGGTCAAQFLPTGGRAVVFAGPKSDQRSCQRVNGFVSIRQATVIHADGWFVEHGLKRAAAVARSRPDVVFCCNDRLAEGLIRANAFAGQSMPSIMGFDDAPVAAELNLNTIAIPWEKLVSSAASLIQLRLAGDRSTAVRQVVAPIPILRDIRHNHITLNQH